MSVWLIYKYNKNDSATLHGLIMFLKTYQGGIHVWDVCCDAGEFSEVRCNIIGLKKNPDALTNLWVKYLLLYYAFFKICGTFVK